MRAIRIPIAANAISSSPILTGTIEANMPAGQPAATVCTIWMLIACKKGSNRNHVRNRQPSPAAALRAI
jgi:hypothetical protein